MTRTFKATVATIVALIVLAFAASTTFATKPDPEHKVAICHRTASDTNPYVYIEVDEASLDAHFNNLPGHPAKEWKTDGTFRGFAHVAGDLKMDYLAEFGEASCVDSQVEATPTPTVDPSVEPTPEPTVEPTPEQSLIPPATATPKADVPNTAMTFEGQATDWLTVLGFALLFLGLGAVSFRALVNYRLR